MYEDFNWDDWDAQAAEYLSSSPDYSYLTQNPDYESWFGQYAPADTMSQEQYDYYTSPPSQEELGSWGADLTDVGQTSVDDLTSLLGYNWGDFDTQSADYLRDAYPALMNSDDSLMWEINAMGQDDLYNVVADQLKSGLITPDEAQNILSGKTSDGAVYDFSSPEQDKALEAERSMLTRMRAAGKEQDYAKVLKQMLAKQALEQQRAKQAYGNSGVGQAMSGLAMAATLAKILGGKNQGATTSARANQGQSFAPTYQAATAPKTKYATGGSVQSRGGLLHLAEQLASMMSQQKGLIGGNGGGQDDIVNIKAAPGEYVMDAEIVSALGDGNNEEGARKLDEMRLNVRKHKRTGGLSSIPPKAKKAEQYVKKGK